jgi:1D-myo-inositol-tetrakisphosphate 5-kinase/inositol-polyphosphate multikinase
MGIGFPHQVAGHLGQLFIDPSDPLKVIKLCQPKEKDFYEAMFNRESLPWKIVLRSWLPVYYGNSNDGTFITLENLVGSFERPSIVDIKLGSVLYDADATDDKKRRLSQVSAETTSGSMGMRICGMKV